MTQLSTSIAKNYPMVAQAMGWGALIGQGLSKMAMPMLALSLLDRPLVRIWRGLRFIAIAAGLGLSSLLRMGVQGAASLANAARAAASLGMLGRAGYWGAAVAMLALVASHYKEIAAYASSIAKDTKDWLAGNKAWEDRKKSYEDATERYTDTTRSAPSAAQRGGNRGLDEIFGDYLRGRGVSRQPILNQDNPATHFGGAPNFGRAGAGGMVNSNNKVVNITIGGTTVNVTQSNASPEAIGTAAGSIVGNKVRGALHDGGNP